MCERIRICRDADAAGNYVRLPHVTTDFDGTLELISILADGPAPTLRDLLVPPRTSLGDIELCVNLNQPVTDVHGMLSVFFSYLNAMMRLDEVVSMAVVACILLFQDNRTMPPGRKPL